MVDVSNSTTNNAEEICEGFWHRTAECDISNLATATIEVGIAVGLTILAIVFSVIFYRFGKRDMIPVIKSAETQAEYKRRRIQQHLPDVLKKVKEIKESFKETQELLQQGDCWHKIDTLLNSKRSANEHTFTFIFSRDLQIKAFKDPQLHEYLKEKLGAITDDMDPELLKDTYHLGTFAAQCLEEMIKNKDNPAKNNEFLSASINSASKIIERFEELIE